MTNQVFQKFLWAMLFLPIAMISCSDDDDDNVSPSSNNNQNSSGQFIYDLNGDKRDLSENATVYYVSDMVTVSASENGDYPLDDIAMTFSDTLSPGNYELGEGGFSAVLVRNINLDSSNNYNVIKATLTIELNDTTKRKAEGEFEFDAVYPATEDTIRVTNGKFQLTEILLSTQK